MAITTDDSTEKTSVSADVDSGTNADATVQPDSAADQNVPDEGAVSEDSAVETGDTAPSDGTEHSSDRKVEVMELLGGTDASTTEEPEIVPLQDGAIEEATPVESGVAVDEIDAVLPATGSSNNLPDDRLMSAIAAESENIAAKLAGNWSDLKGILESIQDSLANTQSVPSKIDALSNDADGLVKQLHGLSLNYELLTAELETISSDAHSKSVLSKTFLIISSLIIVLLVSFQIYLFMSLITIERIQNVAGSSVLENIRGLDKKMAAYDKNLTKSLENPPQQEHAQPNPAVAEKSGHETAAHKEAGPADATPVLAKLNRLRNGLPEKKLIRKETGDWFVYSKKNEECISDVEVIDSLNQAYRKIGRSTSPGIPMPAHNALCILKPDGKGGTQVVMTKEFLP